MRQVFAAMMGNEEAGTCSICGNETGNRVWQVREMMFGRRDAFRYRECAACGALQRLDRPGEPDSYYPADYYAFQPRPRPPLNRIQRFLKRSRSEYCLSGRGRLGEILTARFGRADSLEWMRMAGAGLDSAILDVGCGAGHLLSELRDHGFTHLTGIDPFISDHLELDGVQVYRRELADHAGSYDVVMSHHSFEHMENPRAALVEMRRLLKPGGRMLIRIPVAGSFAWERYRANWVQIDAPRHVFIHTPASLALLAGEAGLKVETTIYDSSELQFWGSEQYLHDIPLSDPRSVWMEPKASIFSPDELEEFRARAQALNREGRGDQACFFLVRKEDGVPESRTGPGA